MRPPVDDISAPEFPPRLEWLNAPDPPRMSRLLGRPVLIEFWDCCRANSIRTLPYVKEWHRRYASDGLQVIGVHTSGFAPSEDPAAVRAATARLGVEHPVAIDAGREIWEDYGNLGWPARYLFDSAGMLSYYHYGEGAYEETELAVMDALGLPGDQRPAPLARLRPEDEPGAELALQSEDVAGAYSGPYEAGGVWAVLSGSGTATANGRVIEVDGAGAYELISHPEHTAGTLALACSAGVDCHAVCFTPGLRRTPRPAAAGAPAPPLHGR